MSYLFYFDYGVRDDFRDLIPQKSKNEKGKNKKIMLLS